MRHLKKDTNTKGMHLFVKKNGEKWNYQVMGLSSSNVCNTRFA